MIDAPSFYKENNFCDFLFAFLHTKPLLTKAIKEKTLLPNSSLLE